MIGDLGLALELLQVGRRPAGQRLGDHPGARRPDPVERGERAPVGPLGDLLGRRVPHDIAGPHERLGLEPALVGAVEAVDDTVERFDRGHDPRLRARCDELQGHGA